MQAIPIGLMVASQLFGAVTESEALKSGARTDEDNARLTELEGALAGEDARRRGRATQGEAIAAAGASGAAIGSQSIGDLIYQNSLEIEYDVLNRRYGAAREAEGLRGSARQKRSAAKGALFGGILRAGAAAVTGISDSSNARRVAEANERHRETRLPGAQRLPIPPHLAPQSSAYFGYRGG